jgi:hypothetical protein
METVAEFCRRERVSMAAFYQWRRKLSPGGGVRRSKDADIGRFRADSTGLPGMDEHLGPDHQVVSIDASKP